MTDTKTPEESHEELMEKMMLTTHIMNYIYPLYHYWKMGGSISELNSHSWIFDGVPREFIAPRHEIEVMNNFDAFHEFRQFIFSHLYKTYVEEWDSDDEEWSGIKLTDNAALRSI